MRYSTASTAASVKTATPTVARKMWVRPRVPIAGVPGSAGTTRARTSSASTAGTANAPAAARR